MMAGIHISKANICNLYVNGFTPGLHIVVTVTEHACELGLHMSLKDRKHMPANKFFKSSRYGLVSISLYTLLQDIEILKDETDPNKLYIIGKGIYQKL